MNNKKRVIEVLNYLRENSNENNPIKTEDIIAYLEEKGYKIERKTIYSDVRELNNLGISIETTHKGYYYDGEQFDIAELKVLIDLVEAAHFLSDKKSKEIKEKLSYLTNKYDRKLIDNGHYKNNKSTNEGILYNIDSIIRSIENKQTITFNYFDINTYNEKKFRRFNYWVCPYSLVVETNRYYLVGYDLKHDNFANYRLDKMENVRPLNKPFKEVVFDINEYMNQTFSMYRGEPKNLTLRCNNELFQEVSQQFGQQLVIVERSEKTFVCNAKTTISPTFFSWIFTFGNKIIIEKPLDVRDEFLRYCHSILDLYHN